jgi:hypothetical protein
MRAPTLAEGRRGYADTIRATPSTKRMVAIASQTEAQRRSSEALGAASPRRAQMKRSHWVRPGIHRSLGALITRRVGQANARPHAMRRAPPTTTRANLHGFPRFSD